MNINRRHSKEDISIKTYENTNGVYMFIRNGIEEFFPENYISFYIEKNRIFLFEDKKRGYKIGNFKGSKTKKIHIINTELMNFIGDYSLEFDVKTKKYFIEKGD